MRRIFLVSVLLLAGCAHGRFVDPSESIMPSSEEPSNSTSVAGPVYIPSYMLNPAVKQNNIKDNICKPGYTDTIRPPSSYTTNLKKQQLVGKSDQDLSHYEEDHWIPLELGGNPIDAHNLWPEPIAEAKKKDVRENADHLKVCNGTMTLEQAQIEMFTNWGPR